MFTTNIHANSFEAKRYDGSFATVEFSDGSNSTAALFLHTPASCDDLIKAAVAARSMLLGETSEPVPQPAAECEEPHPGGRSVCTRKPGHAGGHVDGHGMYWPRHDGGSEDVDAALTPPGYSLPAGELPSETPLCPAKAPGENGGEWQCTLAAGHDGSHEAHGAHPLPVWDGGGVLRYEQEYEVGKR